MILKVRTAFHYLTEIQGIKWRDEDYVANKLVKALKGEFFNGSFRRNVDDVSRVFDNGNASTYTDYVCRRIGSFLAASLARPFLLIPIPNSPAVVANRDDFRAWELGRNIAEHTKGFGTCEDLIRWRRQAPRSHSQGGSRNADVLRANMALRKAPQQEIVLFDDVFTSGAHLAAAARLLTNEGCQVTSGYAFARATRLQMPKAFKPTSENVHY